MVFEHNIISILLLLIVVRSQIRSIICGRQAKYMTRTKLKFETYSKVISIVWCILVRCVLYTGALCAVHRYVVCCTLVRCVLYTGTLCAVYWYVAMVWA